MKLICISDTHCQLENVKVPEGDILLHSGDLTYRGNVQEISAELKKFKPHVDAFKKVIVIDGNHDWLGERNFALMKQMCEE